MPPTENLPVASKSAVETTTSVPPARLWEAASTFVEVAEVAVALSSGVPVHSVIPVKEVAVLPVYLHVPLPPLTVKVPRRAEAGRVLDRQRPAGEILVLAVDGRRRPDRPS